MRLPVETSADVLAVLPAFMRSSDTALTRDAIIALLTAVFKEMQDRGEYAAAQSDLLHARGIYLTGLAEDRDFQRQSGEPDEALRARVLRIPQFVTPSAIMAAVAAIIAPYTAKSAKYFEASLDRWFVSSGDATWHSFSGTKPQYLDRLYEYDVSSNGGVFISNREVNGLWVFDDAIGRYFILRIPPLSGSDDQHSFIGGPAFIGTGSGEVSTFVFRNRQLALDIYATLINTVQRIKGSSFRWMLYVDPTLN